MNRQFRLLRLFLLLFLAITSSAQVAVTTFHNDNSRTGANAHEGILTPANVNSSSFGLLFSQPIATSAVIGQGGTYAQPLCAPNLNVGGAFHNVVYAATEQNMIFAFDADQNQAPLWSQQYGAPIQPRDAQSYLGDSSGIQSTPVIDIPSKTMYFVSASPLNGNDAHFLHAVDITNGLEKFGGPVQIQALVSGNADGGNTVRFNANLQNQRPALMLSNGTVFISWGSYDDDTSLGTYHGWVMAYDARTLSQMAVFNTTPNGGEGSTWALGALAADPGGNIYVGSANGSTDPTQKQFCRQLFEAEWFWSCSTGLFHAVRMVKSERQRLRPQWWRLRSPARPTGSSSSFADLGQQGREDLPSRPRQYGSALGE